MSTSDEGKQICLSAAKLRQEWREESNLIEAEKLFRDAVRKFPDLWMAHFGLGELLLLRAGRSGIESGRSVTVGIRELEKAAQLDPDQPEPLLKLARHLATTDIDTAEQYYRRGLEALRSLTNPFYPKVWQAADHWQFAIGAAENKRKSTAVNAFCRAIEMNDKYAGTHMPSMPKANVAWQSALRKLGRTEWFEQQPGYQFGAHKRKTGCLSMFLLFVCTALVIFIFLN